jgi:tetraacyldisaccharide 4'-kinase
MKLFSARRLLVPLVPLYQSALTVRELGLFFGLEPVRRLRFPVISVGNLSTGGAGKTPLTIELVKALKQNGLRVDVLSRGYGRQSRLAARVNPKGTAAEFGDEPLLIAREAEVPVYVAPRRYDAGLLAEVEQSSADKEAAPVDQGPSPATEPTESKTANEADKSEEKESSASEHDTNRAKDTEKAAKASAPGVCVHLLDDGFQHRQLAREVNILLLNRQDWQDWLLPAGNLRESLRAIQRATVIAIPENERELEIALRAWGWQGPVWQLNRTMKIPTVKGPAAAFCGIARPEQFFTGLEAAGLQLAAQFAFPDHFAYTSSVLKEMLAEASAAGAKAFVTTEKDMVRLEKLTSIFPKNLPLVTAKLQIKIKHQGAAIDWLVDRVTPAKPAPSHPKATAIKSTPPAVSSNQPTTRNDSPRAQ